MTILLEVESFYLRYHQSPGSTRGRNLNGLSRLTCKLYERTSEGALVPIREFELSYADTSIYFTIRHPRIEEEVKQVESTDPIARLGSIEINKIEPSSRVDVELYNYWIHKCMHSVMTVTLGPLSEPFDPHKFLFQNPWIVPRD